MSRWDGHFSRKMKPVAGSQLPEQAVLLGQCLGHSAGRTPGPAVRRKPEGHGHHRLGGKGNPGPGHPLKTCMFTARLFNEAGEPRGFQQF